MLITTYLSKVIRSLLAVSTLGVMSFPLAIAQVPAQYPLLNTSGGGVPPNFMLTMDDSGSMAFKHMPEEVFAGGTFATANPVRSNTVRWDPSDTYRYGVNPFGTVLGNLNSTNYVLRALRSPDTNTIFYNPEIRYQPWAVSTFPLPVATALSPAGRMANSPPTAAFLDPVNQPGTTVDLTSYSFTAVPGTPGGSGKWCYFDPTYPASATPATPPVISIKLLVTGLTYTIVSKGTSDFRTVGSNTANNVTNGRFVATGFGNAASGTGTAQADTPPLADCALRANSDPLVVNHDPGVYFRLGTQTYPATALMKGASYTIKTSGSTNFTLIGAANNLVGTTFIASATNTGTGSGDVTGYKDVTVYTNYTGYSINVNTSFPKAATRSDCAGATCTRTEERQNFANWYTYYRNRNLLARGAMMEAFATVGNTIRLGFGRINKPIVSGFTVDGVATTVIEDDQNTTYGGGGVRPFDQTRKTQLFDWLKALPASGGTPLPAAVQAVGEYYKRADNRGPYTDDPSIVNIVGDNKTCRRSYNLLMTDGYWNGAVTVGNVDGSLATTVQDPGVNTYTFLANSYPFADTHADTLADVAMKYWVEDLQPSMANKVRASSADPTFWQNMTLYTVGLGVRGDLDPATDLPALAAKTKVWGAPSSSLALPANIDDLWHAALNTRGTYTSAKDPATLATAVASALVGAQGGFGATAGVATVSSVLQNGNKKYVPNYDGNVWSGDVEALPLGSNGQAGLVAWNAASRFPAVAAGVPLGTNRNIYTWDTAPIASPSTPGAVPFLWPSLSSANQVAMTSGSADLVNFLRGDDDLEVNLLFPLRTFRARKNKAGNHFILGDIVNSNPVLIKGLFDGGYGGLGLGAGTSTYQIFTAAKTARDGVLFVGSNDGMLHGFKDVNAQLPLASTDATDGLEVFAYVPKAVYGNLSKLSDPNYGALVPHQFFVDGPQREYDAFVAGPAYPAFNGMPACAAGATCWRNFLVGSLGAGGKTVYALDVTSSPNLGSSNIRWELSDVDLGYVMAPIQIGVLPSGKWVAIFGNGYSSTNGKATLFVVDIETAAVTKLDVDTSGNGLGGVGIVKDANGVIQTLYAGDLKGNVWRFNYNTPAVPFVVAGGVPFFTGLGTAQPVTQPPAIFDHSQGGKIIVFATGSLFTVADASTTGPQTIYGLWDKPADTLPRPLATSVLQPRTLSVASGTAGGSTFYNLTGIPVNWTAQRGWKVDVTTVLIGGRIVYPPQVFTSKLVLVTAVAPAQSAAVCTSNLGVGADFVFNVEDGLQATYPLFDTSGTNGINSGDVVVAGVLTNSVGIRAVVTGVSGNVGSSGGAAPTPICQPGYHPISIQTSTGQSLTCVPDDVNPNNRPFDRVQRRIINPPIR
jgi:type IV pilus assembly protein PilY1